MAGTINTDDAPGTSTVLEERSEMEFLRQELERYRNVFESASMIVGHELIKPLTSISGYVELLEDRFEDASGEVETRYFSSRPGYSNVSICVTSSRGSGRARVRRGRG